MDHNQMIEVIAAHRDGKEIQFRLPYFDWHDAGDSPDWDFSCRDYRIKPSPPKPREFWLIPISPDEFMTAREKEPGPHIKSIRVIEVLPTSGEPQFNADGIPNCALCGKSRADHWTAGGYICPNKGILDEQGEQSKHQAERR